MKTYLFSMSTKLDYTFEIIAVWTYLLIKGIDVSLSGTVLLGNHFDPVTERVVKLNVQIIRDWPNIDVLVDSHSVLESDGVRGKEVAVEEFREMRKHNLWVSKELFNF